MPRVKATVEEIKISVLEDQIRLYKRDERIMKLLIKQQAKRIKKLEEALKSG